MSTFHRSELRLASLTVAALATAVGLMFSAGAASASAATTTPIDDPLAVIGQIAPELLAETRAPLGADEAAAVRAQTGVDPLRVELPGDAAGPIRLSPATTEGAGWPVTLTLQGAGTQTGTETTAEQSGGITVYHAQGASSATYAQPLADGLRLLTALADSSAGTAFGYELDLPEGFTTQVIPGGDTVVADAEGRYLGSLAPAWARDAHGRELATEYRWSGDTLTQHVDLAPDTAFPVLLDPKWFYSYDFSSVSTGWPATHPKASDVAVDHLLHGCFNCWFPVAGASRGYPVNGAVMNLNASPFTIITVPAPVKVQTANGGALQFVATSGHFDGAGSTITFAWYNDVNGYLHLYVHAMVMVDRGPTVNVANSRVAGVTWLSFWKRVADNADGSSGGGGV